MSILRKDPYRIIRQLRDLTPENCPADMPKDYKDMVKLIHGVDVQDNDKIKKVFEIYNSPFQRNAMEALLLGRSCEKISEDMGIDVDIVKSFKEICFNPDVFVNKVEKMEYISALKNEIVRKNRKKGEDPEGMEFDLFFLNLKLYAICGWSIYVDWMLGIINWSDKTKVKDLINKIILEASMLAKESATNKEYEESRRWIKTVTSLVDALAKLEASESVSGSKENEDITDRIKKVLSTPSPQPFDFSKIVG